MKPRGCKAFRAISEPLGKIDKVVMIDQGGGNGDGVGGINRFAQTGPTLIFSLLQQLQALGINLPEIVSQLGVKGGDDQLKQPPALTKDSSFKKTSEGSEK